MKKKRPVIVEEVLKQRATEVWNAITELEHMQHWFFENIPDFKAEVGFKTSFVVQSGQQDFIHLWEITEVVPLKRIVYKWCYEGYSGESFVIFELKDMGDVTRLKVSHLGLESFPDHIPEFTRESCQGGWNYFIKDQLKAYLDQNIKPN